MPTSSPSGAVQKKQALLVKLSDYLLEKGLLEASLRPMAEALGTSDRMLLYYFGTKAGLLDEVFRHLTLSMANQLDACTEPDNLPADQLSSRILAQLKSQTFTPYMTLWLQMAALASGGDDVCKAGGARFGQVLLAWIAAQIDSSDEKVRTHDAALVLVLVKGHFLLNRLGLPELADLEIS